MENSTAYWHNTKSETFFSDGIGININKTIVGRRIYTLYNKVKWKWNFLKDMKALGTKGFTFKDILFDLLSPKIKNRNFNTWKEFPKKIAHDVFGLTFPIETPGRALSDVVKEGAYFGYDDFLPDKTSVVVDIGAQYGDYALMCSKVFSAKKVISFEPLQSVYSLFAKAIRLNSTNNIEAHNIALSSTDGISRIGRIGQMACKLGGEGFETKTAKLDSLISDRVDIIKIDVEGFEVDVLQGAHETIKKYHPKIIVETHSVRLRKEVIEFLSQFGYSVRHAGTISFTKVIGMDYLQNLYLN